MPEFDIVIKDGMIIDGTRAPRIRGDIGIKNGRIAKIGRIPASDGQRGDRRARPYRGARASSTSTPTTTRNSSGIRS